MKYSESEIETLLRTGENEGELRREFGDLLYDELSSLARQVGPVGPLLEAMRRKVFILPGIMGSRLSVIDNGVQDLIWLDPVALVAGGVAKLRLGGPHNVAATGTILAAYMRMRLRLRLAGFDASFLPYDWRLAPAVSGEALMKLLRRQGARDVTLVGHSMGGLVARAMAAQDGDRAVISRVITVGTPNHGSYAPVEIFAATNKMLDKIAAVDLKHTKQDIAAGVLRHFPGLLQMMPDPKKRPTETYFASKGWPRGTIRPLKAALDAAFKGLTDLPPPDDRFVQIIGAFERTVVGARQAEDGFTFSLARDGDGTVPRDLAETPNIERYYTKGTHGSLCNRGDVIEATIDLIETGRTKALPDTLQPRFSETADFEEVTADMLTERRVAEHDAPPQAETDFAGDFLTNRMGLATKEIDKMVIDRIGTSVAHTGGYPVHLLKEARARWNGSRAERKNVEQKMREAHPLQAESPERKRAYTNRLLKEVEGKDPRIVKDLERAVSIAEGGGAEDAEMKPEDSAFLERVIGEAEEFLSVMFVKRAVTAAGSVGRVIKSDTQRGFGTGFLVAPGIMMTNHHVLGTAQEAKGASVQFLYELEIDSRETGGHIFRLEPDRLFFSDPELDMAIVAVSPLALDGISISEFGQLPLVSAEGKIHKGQPVNIVQHPLGGRKQVVFRESYLSALPEDADHVAHYTGDTQPGSSGSPVFSDRWEVVALHHSGVPDTNGNGDFLDIDGQVWDEANDPKGRTIKWVANEGIRISRIMRVLKGLPERLEAEARPGADLVRGLLAVSEEATRMGVFTASKRAEMRRPEAMRARREEQPRMDELHAHDATMEPVDAIEGTTITLPLRVTVSFPEVFDVDIGR